MFRFNYFLYKLLLLNKLTKFGMTFIEHCPVGTNRFSNCAQDMKKSSLFKAAMQCTVVP